MLFNFLDKNVEDFLLNLDWVVQISSVQTIQPTFCILSEG